MTIKDLTQYPYAIFDMDGTLIDSMPYWRKLGRDYLGSRGVDAEPDMEAVIRSMTVAESARYFKEHYGLRETPEEIIAGFEDVMQDNYRLRIPAKPGVPEYLRTLHAAGIRLSICSATSLPLVRMVLDRLGLLSLFDHITSCEEAGAGKYKPDAFLLALSRAGALPQQTVMYEDADYAVRTAAAVGLHVAAVYDPFCMTPPEQIRQMAEFYIQDFRDLLDPDAAE